MKILWITNIPIGKSGDLFYNQKKTGLWMDVCLNEISQLKNIDLFIVTSGDTSFIKKAQDKKVIYYLIPGGDAIRKYRVNSKKNIKLMNMLINEVQPDLIHIWGTEGNIGETIINLKTKIPIIITMQGFLYSISKHYFDGIHFHEVLKMISVRNILKRDSVISKSRSIKKQVIVEKKLISNSDCILISNDWGESMLQVISPNTRYLSLLLPINKLFLSGKWKNNNNHTIICNAPYAPFKGFHILLKAMSLVKKDFPNAILLVPGAFQPQTDKFLDYLKRDGYSQYIFTKIKKYNLIENVIFLGQLSQEDLKVKMEESQIFCMSSAIENHASTLMEAMSIGMPCVTSEVGGISEYVIHGENALSYRYEEYEHLAFYIKKLFTHSNLRNKLSSNAKLTISNLYDEYNIGDKLNDVYKTLNK